MSYTWTDFAGNVGVALIIGSYLLLQMQRIDPLGFNFSALNAMGALLIIVSLLIDFNLSAFIVEAFWFVISLYGLLRLYRLRRATAAQRRADPDVTS